MQKKEFSTEIGGKKLTATFSDLADQANSSLILTYGETSVLATATMSQNTREGMDFFPLVVDYEERFYAAGEILGSRYMRREGRPSEEAVLTGRIIDRTIRPLFEQHIRNEIQIVITVLSIGEDDPDIISVIAASLALSTSDIPWNGPVSATRVGKDSDGNLSINPSYTERKNNPTSDTIVCGRDGNINMIDVNAYEITEDEMETIFLTALKEIEKLQTFQSDIIREIGKEKIIIPKEELSQEATDLFEKNIMSKLDNAVFSGAGKHGIRELEKEWLSLLRESLPDEKESLATKHYDEVVNEIIHKEAITNKRRADGRAMNEVRPLYAQAGGISPIIHGTGIFYRGGTHIFSALTLAGPKEAQIIDSIEFKGEKRYMHHYNFPPFGVGETGRVGGFNRRMIGHGALAEKSLVPVLPSKKDFPYTIRIVSEAFASNGSTSMGSVCGSTLALMDAGVPIKSPVAGIAIGLMYKDENNYEIVTDIQGPEDHHGDMDFKVAGTRDGITAIQMDVKVDGIPIKILSKALKAARDARLTVLDVIESEIKEPRKEISKRAPHIITMNVKPDQIGMIIGSGGKTINSIIEKTSAKIDIEDDGTIFIIGKDDTASKAADMIEQIVHKYKPGERYEGDVVKILDFGAFVKITPYAEGLVHISEMAPVRVEKVTDLLKEGDRVPVVVKEVDEKGRINLSIKKADADFFKEKLSKKN